MKYIGTFLLIMCLTGCIKASVAEEPKEPMYPESVVKELVKEAYAIGRNHKIEGCKQRMNDSVKGD
ncbi:hypothetical protein D3C87_1418780 [compost metagenome]